MLFRFQIGIAAVYVGVSGWVCVRNVKYCRVFLTVGDFYTAFADVFDRCQVFEGWEMCYKKEVSNKQ